MSPTKRKGIYYLYVPKQKGGVVLRTTGTGDARTFRLMRAMVAELKDTRRWPLLMAVVEGRLTLGAVHDAYRANGLAALEVSLSAQHLAQHVTAYLAACRGRGLAPRNVENIDRQLASFIGLDTTTADLTPAKVTAWLSGLTTSPGTRRQYLYAVTGFVRYLVDVGVLADYPLTRVKAPKKNPARMTYHDAATDERIVLAASPKYRALFAFIKGTGADVTTALHITRRDIDWKAATVRLRGTKTATRDVHRGIIEPWALRYVETDNTHTLHNAPLWPGLTRSGAYHHHERCCAAVGVEDYTLKDSRHSVAVRMAEAGYTVFEIAEQLGTSPELVARVYARFIPKMASRVTPHVTRVAGEPS
jgi:integrase